MGWRWKNLRLGWVAFGLAAMVGCGREQVGGQTGGEDAERQVRLPGAGPAMPLCNHEPPVSLAGLDEAPSGLSAREVLAMAVPEGALAISWHAEGPFGGPLREIQPAPAGPEPVDLEIAYDMGRVWYLGPGDCQRVEVEVEVTMRSDSGAFDERATAVLHATRLTRDDQVRLLEARLEWVLEPPGVRLVGAPVRGTDDNGPEPPITPQGGTLGIEATHRYAPPGSDPDFGEPSLSERARLVAVPVLVIFYESGVRGFVDAWLQGHDTGNLIRAEQVATFEAAR